MWHEGDAVDSNATPYQPASRRGTVRHVLSCRYPYEACLQTCGVLLGMLVVYGVVLAAIGGPAKIHEPVWCVCVIWICAQAAGYVSSKVGLPPVIGMVGIGLLLRNVGSELEKLPFMWSVKLRLAGLAVALLQCGLSVSQASGQTSCFKSLLLAALPALLEATAVGLCLGLWLKLNVFMAIAGGLILAPVCPALLHATMNSWQQCGLGISTGIPPHMLAAARWQNFLTIAAFSCFLGLAVPHQTLALRITHGPISIAAGTAAGCALGLVCAATPIWSSTLRRAGALLVMAELMAFCGVTWHYTAAGYIGVIAMAATSGLVWQKAAVSRFCNQIAPGASISTGQGVHEVLELLWAGALQPLVMGLAGASVRFDALPSHLAARALALAAIGLGVRFGTAFLALLGSKADWGERLAMSLVWLSAGTVQATLAAAPQLLVQTYHANSSTQMTATETLVVAGVLYILLGSTIAWLSAAFLGPAVLTKAEAELPVTAVPESPEANENNPFLSGLQQSGISMTTGRKQQHQVRGILHKSEDAAMHPHHGNPFSEDGSAEEQHEKPLLIASAGSSYAMDAPHRLPSYNPFTAPSKNGDYHTLRTVASIRRITSGEAPGSPLGPRRSASSVPALVRPKVSKRVSLEIDDRRRTSESFLWENEPMSAAAMLGNQGIPSDHPLGKSFTKRSSSNASLDDAASCLWENEPMSAAASLITVLRSSLPAVPESEQTPDEPPSSKRKGVPRLAVNTGARHSHHGTAWRPRRPAPSPPQRANSFPLPQQNEDFLEYDIVNNGLTLQETPRSSRSSVKDFPAAAPLPAPAMRNEPAEPIAFGPANSVSELAHHHNAHDSAMHAHVTSVPEAVSETVPAQLVGEAAVPTIAHMQVHDASIAASAVTAPQAHSAETGASAPAYIASDDSIINRFIEDALQLSRKGSVATLYESAHSGSVGLPDDVPTI